MITDDIALAEIKTAAIYNSTSFADNVYHAGFHQDWFQAPMHRAAQNFIQQKMNHATNNINAQMLMLQPVYRVQSTLQRVKKQLKILTFRPIQMSTGKVASNECPPESAVSRTC